MNIFSVAQGAVARQKDSGNDMSDVDATDRVLHDITFGTAVTVSPSSLNCEAFPLSFPKNQGLNYASGIRKPGGYTTSQKHVYSSNSFLTHFSFFLFFPGCIHFCAWFCTSHQPHWL